MRDRILTVVSALVAGAISIALAACGSEGSSAADDGLEDGLEGASVKVGYVASLSGFLAPFDTLVTNGAKLAVEEINADGGVAGRVRLELQLYDNKSDPAVTTTVTQALIDDGADVLLPPCNADFQVAVASVADREGTPVFSPCNADPTITRRFPIYTPAGMGGNRQAAAMADYVASAGLSRAYVLDAPDFLFVKLISRYFRAAAEARDIAIVGTDVFKVGDTDFASQVTRIKNASPQPDVIVTGAFSPDIAIFAKQLRAAGVDIPIVGTDGADTGLTLKTGGAAVDGLTFTTFGFPSPGSPTADFYDAYEARFRDRPDGSYAALGYNAIKVLAAAIERAGSVDAEAIQTAIDEGMTVDDSATGSIVYPGGGERNPIVSVAVVQVRDRRLALLETLEPDDVPAP
jgi:branched-chain amino acid transport system substrate-binding protein